MKEFHRKDKRQLNHLKATKMYLYGASGHGKVIAEIAEINNKHVEGFIDENPSIKNIWNYKVYAQIPQDAKEMIISIGDNHTRKLIYEANMQMIYPNLIHTSANLSQKLKIGKGTVMMAGSSVNSDTQIGMHCIINTNASVDHDCLLEDFVHISPNAALAGGVSVGEGSHIGIGASVIQGIKIGKWATVGAGTVVIADIPDFAVAVGNPAKVLKFKNK